jgi:hypothetical protein
MPCSVRIHFAVLMLGIVAAGAQAPQPYLELRGYAAGDDPGCHQLHR